MNDGVVLAELTKVVAQGIKLYLSIILGLCGSHSLHIALRDFLRLHLSVYRCGHHNSHKQEGNLLHDSVSF